MCLSSGYLREGDFRTATSDRTCFCTPHARHFGDDSSALSLGATSAEAFSAELAHKLWSNSVFCAVKKLSVFSGIPRHHLPPTGINTGWGQTSIALDRTPRSPGLREYPRLKSFLASQHLNESLAGEKNPSGVSGTYLMTGMFAPILVNSPTPPMVTCEVSCRVDPFTWVPTICTL